jgi:hypothetical protein
MSVIAQATSAAAPPAGSQWLRNRRWDLTFITLSVILVTVPYGAYILLLKLGPVLKPMANLIGADIDSFSRNLVNATVALLVGGPHMYATWTRTARDVDFFARHRTLIYSSLIIPVVVISLALVNLQLLLTIFFLWASIHVLHQIIYINDLYENRRAASLSLVSRLADYGVILTALYPLAAWKISTGRFAIGPNNLSQIIGNIVPLGPWMVWLAGGAFGLAFTVWAIKTIIEWRRGTLHIPKTVFIALTVTASFFVPALGNLDTAFQGMNVWHSFQYLALTWMLNNMRYERGDLKGSTFVQRLSESGSARRYYLFTMALTIADVALAGLIFVVIRFAFGKPFDYAFDRAYYIAVLSFLWIHYYFDHYLFAQPSIVRAS